jgi:Ser-tRNA(Ala) deacylase AlaX
MSESAEMPLELPPTDMLYMTYEGNWLTECTAKVLSVSAHNPGEDESVAPLAICLDRTVMHAQGGGQPTDVGRLEITATGVSVDVSKVLIDRETGVATHFGTLSGKTPPRVGDSATVKLNVSQRRILSECHTAGHVVDSAMARCGKLMEPTKAYHFLDGPYVEYKGSVPIEERDSVLQELQEAFCQLVDEGFDTKIDILSKEEADELCNRQAQNFDVNLFADKRTQQIRVVTVAGFPCPCGGTHVRSTTELKQGRWGITGLKSKKGVVRVKYGRTSSS